MNRVRKAIIPAAGLGTRFLPATKAMPKEMLPIVDKPTIQFIVEEAIASGIEDLIIVTGKGKRSIEDHFDHALELEKNLMEKQKYELLETIQNISKMIDIHYIRQKEPLGLGHAVWCARNFIGNEPFAVLLGDDIVQSEVPCLLQLKEIYNKRLASVIGVKRVPLDQTHRYGIVDPIESDDRTFQVRNFIEKPVAGTAPSDLAIIGRYILTPEIFIYLEDQQKGSGDEIQLTDAIQRLNENQRVFAYEFEGRRFDVGEKMGFIETTIEFALQKPELREELLKFMQEKIEMANYYRSK